MGLSLIENQDQISEIVDLGRNFYWKVKHGIDFPGQMAQDTMLQITKHHHHNHINIFIIIIIVINIFIIIKIIIMSII